MDSEGQPDAIRVVIADGDPHTRKTIREALMAGGIAVVAEAADGDEVVALATFYHPDAVVIDVRLPGAGGVTATSQIHERSPGTCIVLLADAAEEDLGLRAIRAGASGYLARTLEPVVGVIQMRDHAGQLFQQAGHLTGRYGGPVARVKSCGAHDQATVRKRRSPTTGRSMRRR